MPLDISPVRSTADREAFITFPWQHYRDDPNWVAPLLMSERKLLTPGKHPFFEHAKVEFFLARRDGQVAGRVAAIQNQAHNDYWKDKVGFFGFFECENNPESAHALLAAAEKFLRGEGCDTMRGPCNYSTNETCGLLVKGNHRTPVIMMTYNPPWYEDLLKDFGLAKAMDLFAWHMNIDIFYPGVFRMAERTLKRGNFTLRDANMRDFAGEINRIKEIYHSAWADNWGFVPMTDAEIDFMAHELKPIVDPRIVHFVEHGGRTVAFQLAIPDYNIVLQPMMGRLLPFGWRHLIGAKKKINRYRIITMGVLPEYRHKGLDAVMYARAIQDAFDYDYPMGELSWILDNNHKMNKAIETMGGIHHKTYRLFDKALV